jgi:hypothetical protein
MSYQEMIDYASYLATDWFTESFTDRIAAVEERFRDMKLRNYADADIREWHKHAVRVLRRIHDEHSIAVEIDRINEQHGPIPDFPGEVRYPTPEAVYERDLKHNHALNAVLEQTPSEAYKRYGNLDIAGNIAVVDDGGIVQWASTLPGYADGYRPGAESRTAMGSTRMGCPSDRRFPGGTEVQFPVSRAG